MGRNNTPEKKLGPFGDRFVKQLAGKPGLKIISDQTGTLGGIPARLVTAEMQAEDGGGNVRHYFAAVALKGNKLYTCTMVSNLKKVSDDEVLTEFFNSIEISP